MTRSRNPESKLCPSQSAVESTRKANHKQSSMGIQTRFHQKRKCSRIKFPNQVVTLPWSCEVASQAKPRTYGIYISRTFVPSRSLTGIVLPSFETEVCRARPFKPRKTSSDGLTRAPSSGVVLKLGEVAWCS